MRQTRVLYHLMRADFLERVRRYSFLVTLGLAVWLGWAVSTGKLKLWISDSRGFYNSAWVGLLYALVVNVFVSLAGFYVVKNAVERDRRTGVGQILATTPMSKVLYTLGKPFPISLSCWRWWWCWQGWQWSRSLWQGRIPTSISGRCSRLS